MCFIKSKFTLRDDCIVMQFRTKIRQTFLFFLVSLNESEKYTTSGNSDMMSGEGGGGEWQIACKTDELDY